MDGVSEGGRERGRERGLMIIVVGMKKSRRMKGEGREQVRFIYEIV